MLNPLVIPDQVTPEDYAEFSFQGDSVIIAVIERGEQLEIEMNPRDLPILIRWLQNAHHRHRRLSET